MIRIAKCLEDDYIHSSKIKNFCLQKSLKVSENKADLLRNIIEYAGENESSHNYLETYNWLLDTIKSGSKEFCLKRVYFPEENVDKAEEIILKKYHNCPVKDILSFKNSELFELVNYEIKKNSEGTVSRINFLFSRILLEGDKEYEKGNRIIYPVYIDLYVQEGFIVARYKPKTTIYKCSDTDILYKENRFKPLDESMKLIDELEKLFRTHTMDTDSKQKFCKMMYRLYEKYSFTPANIQEKIESMDVEKNRFIDEVFSKLKLSDINKEKAKLDLDIFLEKYISINGNMEKVFKEDRKAYLIKITSDDDLQMTRIDTASIGTNPLQCTDTFFDGKKSILNTKECKVLHLCYNSSVK